MGGSTSPPPPVDADRMAIRAFQAVGAVMVTLAVYYVFAARGGQWLFWSIVGSFLFLALLAGLFEAERFYRARRSTRVAGASAKPASPPSSRSPSATHSRAPSQSRSE